MTAKPTLPVYGAGGVGAFAGVPQLGQNFGPPMSSVPQPVQCFFGAAATAPQFEQNLPPAG